MQQLASQTSFAAALLDPHLPPPSGVICHRGGVDAKRFAVYRNNVFVGLVRALERTFPVTRRLVGDDFFAAMARAYAAVHRPRSPLLFEYGATLPAFIESFEPARTLPYLADVARVEFAWLAAYHARDAAPLDIAALSDLAPEQIDEQRLAAHPAARLIVSNYPVGSIWAAHQGSTLKPVHSRQPEAVLVARPRFDVHVHVLPAADSAFAASLLSGATLTEAASIAGANDGFDFGSALVRLTTLGAFETAGRN